METEQLTGQVIAARLTAAIKDGDLTEIAKYRTLQQCLPLQQLLREAEARVDRWTAPMEAARAACYQQTMEQRKQQEQFGEGSPALSLDRHGNTVDARFPGDTRKDLGMAASRNNTLAGKLQNGQEEARSQVAKIQRVVTETATAASVQPEGGWQKLFYDLWAVGEDADRAFRALTETPAAPRIDRLPSEMISLNVAEALRR